MGLMQGPLPRPVASEEEVRETIRELSERVAELEEKVEHASGEPRALVFSDDKLATIATSFYRSRQMRSRFFDSALLGEPAWDMLLDLFIHRVQGRRLSTSSLCLGANAPHATGLRWIAILEREGLVRRGSAANDARVRLVDMTPKGFRLMRRFIAYSVTRFQMPLPD
jgi:hypothetical protein